MAGVLAQKQAAAKQKTKSQQKGKAPQLPASVQSLSPAELKQFLAIAFVKFMHGKLGLKAKPQTKIWSDASLSNKVDALKDSLNHSDDIPRLQTKKVYAP